MSGILITMYRKGQEILDALAQSASVVVAEEPFCVPFLKGVERLVSVLSAGKHNNDSQATSPLWLVDTCGVVPCSMVCLLCVHHFLWNALSLSAVWVLLAVAPVCMH